MITTSLSLGYKASRAYLEQIYDGDSNVVDAIPGLFADIAAENDSSASLCIETSQVTVDIDEPDYDYASWLEEATTEAGRAAGWDV